MGNNTDWLRVLEKGSGSKEELESLTESEKAFVIKEVSSLEPLGDVTWSWDTDNRRVSVRRVR